MQKVVGFEVKDEHLARDIMQDFFVKLMDRPLPDDIRDMKSYLFRAIQNDIKNARRRLARYREHLEGYKEYRTIRQQRTEHADRKITQAEDIEKLLEAVNLQLPQRERQAIVLKYVHGYDSKQISAEMGIKPRSIARYMSVGLKKLRDYLAARGDIE
ncbi:MAG: sigma-70 family RNA polymerase sigma factor [Sedimentisphaerales bacterium]|nr:sigma-70 family RNA polymerase sigma factor [Sedimentisphaerales bacterium]